MRPVVVVASCGSLVYNLFNKLPNGFDNDLRASVDWRKKEGMVLFFEEFFFAMSLIIHEDLVCKLTRDY